MHKVELSIAIPRQKENPMNRLSTVLAALCLAFFILTSSVMLTLSFKNTYALSRGEIIEAEYRLDEETIRYNYNHLIDYMFSGPDAKLSFRELPMSPEGEFHFMEVKAIFRFFFTGMVISGIAALSLGFYLVRRRSLAFLNAGSVLVFLIPAILSIPVLIDFNKTFLLFHEIAFSNDYWIFDPAKDPIIRYLPESLFLKNTLIILILIVLWIILVQVIRKTLKRRLINGL